MLLAKLSAKAFDKEMRRATGYRCAAAAEGAGHGEHVKAEKEVGAEAAFLDGFLKIAVAGGDDAHIYLDGAAASQRLEFMLLQHAQQLDLCSRGNSLTSSRKSVPPSASSNRPVRCSSAPVKAPFMWPNSSLSTSPVGIAPQLTFTSGRFFRLLRLWIARAISSFPQPVSPKNQYCGVSRGDRLHLPQHVEQRGAVAHDLLEIVLLADFFLQVNILGFQLLLERLNLL